MASTSDRVQQHRQRLRHAGLRPVQPWVPDTRRPGFALECRRQSLLLADDATGLRLASDVMVDQPQSVRRDKVGEPIGRLADDTMLRVNRALALFLGFA